MIFKKNKLKKAVDGNDSMKTKIKGVEELIEDKLPSKKQRLLRRLGALVLAGALALSPLSKNIYSKNVGENKQLKVNYEVYTDKDKTKAPVLNYPVAIRQVRNGRFVGVNLGAVENGISTYEAHYFFLPLWNGSFSPLTNHPGVLDWFTIIIGLISVVTLAIHGANWIVFKTNSSINNKLKNVVFKLTIALIILTIFSLLVWGKINTTAFANFKDNPLLLIFPLIYLFGLFSLLKIRTFKKEVFGLLASTLVILGGITTSLASMFPVILPSTNTINKSLTIFNTATEKEGLNAAFVWGIIGIILMIVYLIIQNKLLKGKIDNRDYGH